MKVLEEGLGVLYRNSKRMRNGGGMLTLSLPLMTLELLEQFIQFQYQRDKGVKLLISGWVLCSLCVKLLLCIKKGSYA